MKVENQSDLLSSPDVLGYVRMLLADMHDDLEGSVSRFRQLTDLSVILGPGGAMFTGGETAYIAWLEARGSFVHGNYMATVMLCQGLAEHLLASYLELPMSAKPLPPKVSFAETLRRCVDQKVISDTDADDLKRLMSLRNPLSHYRPLSEEDNLSRRVLDSLEPASSHLKRDAHFAIGMAIRLLALPAFRLSGETLGP